MEETIITESVEKNEIVPVWGRIVIFVVGLPLMLLFMPIVMLFIAIAFEVGVVVIMVEFLITGESKTSIDPMEKKGKKANESK